LNFINSLHANIICTKRIVTVFGGDLCLRDVYYKRYAKSICGIFEDISIYAFTLLINYKFPQAFYRDFNKFRGISEVGMQLALSKVSRVNTTFIF
jgi:hypothetical protein